MEPLMPIDIDRLTEDELRDLHSRITERLRVIQQLRAHGTMMKFSIGERVTFTADGRRVFGVLVRYNKRTVTIIGDGGLRWNVSPGFVERVVPGSTPRTDVPVVEAMASLSSRSVLARIGRGRGGRS
jgi:hypothetical protein